MKNSIVFLKDLKNNNNREWFQTNKKRYDLAHLEAISFADKLLFELKKHDNIETASGKKSLFRIYNDVRFSKDKSPYKSHWGIRFSRATPFLRGGYYLHFGIENVYAIGGFFNPNADDLLHIRNQLAQYSDPLRIILNSKDFKEFFGELKGEQLKTAPRGFEKDHPELDLLRYKQFLIRRDFTKKEIESPEFHEIVCDAFVRMHPFFNYMSEILTSDLNGESLI